MGKVILPADMSLSLKAEAGAGPKDEGCTASRVQNNCPPSLGLHKLLFRL